MKIGYARVSTIGQKLDRQIDNLTAAGAERIYQEKYTGTSRIRPELNNMLETLRKGDILVIDSLSRLSRTTKDLLQLIDRLTDIGVELVSLKENIDTQTPTGKFVLTVLAALSQMERDMIVERVNDGLNAARARGVQLGRKPKLEEDKRDAITKAVRSGAMSAGDASRAYGVSIRTIYRWMAATDE